MKCNSCTELPCDDTWENIFTVWLFVIVMQFRNAYTVVSYLGLPALRNKYREPFWTPSMILLFVLFLHGHGQYRVLDPQTCPNSNVAVLNSLHKHA